MLTIWFSGAEGKVMEPEVLTSGMVGKQIRLEFTEDWKDLAKTVVFTAGNVTRDALCTGETVAIPAEVMEKPLVPLYVGVYGVGADGLTAIPTIRVNCGEIKPGVDPSGDPGVEPTPGLWAQLEGAMGDLTQLETQARDSLVAAVNEVWKQLENGEPGATFIPAVSASGVLSWSNDKGLPNPAEVNIQGPAGKSAYTYAQAGGFTGSETEFAERLATDTYSKAEIDAVMGSYIEDIDALIGGNG